MKRAVKYERTLSGSFMIIDAAESGFDEKLLLKKKLPGFLEMKRCTISGMGQFWYDITGKQSLDTLCSIKKINVSQMKKMILCICYQIEELEKNLISPDCLVLDEELIFVDNQTGDLFFMADPGEDRPLSERFREWMEYLLTKIDHGDRDAVRASYELYQITLDEGYSIADIRRAVLDEKKPEEKAEGKIKPEAEQDGQEGSRSFSECLIVEEKETGEKETGEKEVEDLYSDSYLRMEESVDLEKKKRKRKKAKEKKKTRDSDSETAGFLVWLFRKIRRKWSGLPGGEEKETAVTKEPDEFFVDYSNVEETEETDLLPPQNPTVCLTSYETHPEGILLYEGREGFVSIRISRESMIIGKGKDADIRLERDTISHLQAKVTKNGENYYLEDMNSTNGTFINGTAVNFKEKTLLKINDIVRFADVKYRFI